MRGFPGVGSWAELKNQVTTGAGFPVARQSSTAGVPSLAVTEGVVT